MDKLIMLSIVIAIVLFPAVGARMSSPQRGLMWSLVAVAFSMIIYTIVLVLIAINLINTTTPPGYLF